MISIGKNISFLLALCFLCNSAQAASLDTLYRDVIRSDNDGYLPLFVKNRSEPNVLDETQILQKVVTQELQKNDIKSNPLNLTNNTMQKEAIKKSKQLKWEQTIKAVQENRVTPIELEELNYRARLNDAKAIEILAWMYTNGVGVAQDLPKAFYLYRQAEKLQVTDADKNAIAVYKAMSPEQRAKINSN